MCQRRLKIKVCGMRDGENISQIASLVPDYMGFVFFRDSPRNATALLTTEALEVISPKTKTVGVFVDESIETILNVVRRFNFDMVQLHAQESAEYCERLKNLLPEVEVIKAFGISDEFCFGKLEDYADCADYFLFDTYCKTRGGSGQLFKWELLERPECKKPFFLSGGIGVGGDIKRAVNLREKGVNIIAIDINSKVETEPGIKSLALVKQCTKELCK